MTVYSHSRLSAFENCPLQFRYRYIDRLRTDFESVEAFTGKRVHEVLEFVYRDLGRARERGLDAALAIYERLWRENFRPTVRVIRPDLDHEYYRDLGGRCVRTFWERNYPFAIDPDQIIGLELKVEMALDPEGRYRMLGFIDRAQHAGPGVLEIHDYKTTASLPRAGSLRFDRQLPLYEIALRERFPETKEVRLVWHFLAHGVEAVERRTSQDLDRVRRTCISLIQAVERAKEFPSKKGPLCAWCEYQEICPEWRGVRPIAALAFPNGRPDVPAPAPAPLPATGPALVPPVVATPVPATAATPPMPPAVAARPPAAPRQTPVQLRLF